MQKYRNSWPEIMSLKTLKPKIQTLDTRIGTAPATERIRGSKLQKINQRIGLRDMWTCQICGRVDAHGEVDHIQPLHLGGLETDANRQFLCQECHRLKSEKEEAARRGQGCQ